MHAQDTYALVMSLSVIVCIARKKAPVNLLMCPFELYMFWHWCVHAASSCLRLLFFLVLIPYCWSVALEKKKKKKS